MQNDKAPERIWYQIGYSPGNILDIKPWDENSVEYIRADLVAKIDRLKEEIAILRSYGNKDCTAMADAELARRRGETK